MGNCLTTILVDREDSQKLEETPHEEHSQDDNQQEELWSDEQIDEFIYRFP